MYNMNGKKFLHENQKILAFVRVSIDINEECGGVSHLKYSTERNILRDMGLVQFSKVFPEPSTQNDERVFYGFITPSELVYLSNPKSVFHRFGEERPIDSFIVSAVQQIGHAWQCREGGEYLTENELTLRLRHTTRHETYTNHYVQVDFLTQAGWTKLEELYCGDEYYGISDDLRVIYERGRRLAEALVEVNAVVCK